MGKRENEGSGPKCGEEDEGLDGPICWILQGSLSGSAKIWILGL